MPVPSILSTCFEPDNMETEEEKHELDPNFTPSQLTGSQPFNQSEFNDLKNVKNPLFVNKDRTICYLFK